MRRLAGRSVVPGGLALLPLLLAPAASAAKPPDGKAVYMDKCSTCHGKAGTPAPMFANIGVKNLSDPEWQKSRSDQEILAVIAKGSEGTAMRPFKDELQPAELEAVAKFVRMLDTTKGGGGAK